jgi:hypothetical protein
MTKIVEKNTAEKNLSDLQFTYRPLASIKDVQGQGKEFGKQKRTSSNSKNLNCYIFPFLLVIFALLDPDPGTPLNPGPIRSRIHNTGSKGR